MINIISAQNRKEIVSMLFDLKVAIRTLDGKVKIDSIKLNDFGYRIIFNLVTKKPQMQPADAPYFCDGVLEDVDKCEFDESILDQFNLLSTSSPQDFFEDSE